MDMRDRGNLKDIDKGETLQNGKEVMSSFTFVSDVTYLVVSL